MQESIWEGLAPPTPAPSQELELSGASSSCSIRADASREGSSAGLVGLDAPAETYMDDGAEQHCQGQGTQQDFINTLPSDLLLAILSLLDWATKRTSVFLVCRRWAALCSEPSGMWSRVKLDFTWEGRHGQVHGQSLIRWLNRRAAGMRSLSLLRSEPVLTCRPESFIGVERYHHDFWPVPVQAMQDLLFGMANTLQAIKIESCNDLFIGNSYQALGSLTSLTRLELGRLRKSILTHPTTFLSCLTRLISLRMSCEDDWTPGWTVLPQFPPEIERLTQLTHLSISSKGIKQVPPFISSLTALSDLRLCGCSLGMLPREVSTLRSLTLLKLNSNPLGRGPSGDPEYEQSLVCLPEQLSELTSLQRLELMQCKLKTVPEAVLGIGQLQELMLGFNRIDRLPHQESTLRGLANLRHISLFSNRLNCIPKAFGCLQALEELFLDDNLPLEFPQPLDWALALPRLHRLSVVKDMDQIDEIPTHSWSHESLNHLLHLDETLQDRRHGGQRVVRLHYGYSPAPGLLHSAW